MISREVMTQIKWIFFALFISFVLVCFFEGTIVSVGRGTEFPFQIIGYPDKPSGDYFFKPISIPGVAKNPPYEGKECRGFNLGNFGSDIAKNGGKIYINWLILSSS